MVWKKDSVEGRNAFYAVSCLCYALKVEYFQITSLSGVRKSGLLFMT